MQMLWFPTPVRNSKVQKKLYKFKLFCMYKEGDQHGLSYLLLLFRASDILRSRRPAKFPKNAKYREICQKYFQIHVSKTYFILILAIRPVLFTPNVQIYLETSSLQRVNNVPKLTGVFR